MEATMATVKHGRVRNKTKVRDKEQAVISNNDSATAKPTDRDCKHKNIGCGAWKIKRWK